MAPKPWTPARKRCGICSPIARRRPNTTDRDGESPSTSRTSTLDACGNGGHGVSECWTRRASVGSWDFSQREWGPVVFLYVGCGCSGGVVLPDIDFLKSDIVDSS